MGKSAFGNQPFAKRLKELMTERGWNNFELSIRARIREQNVRLWLRGVTPRPHHLVALAEAFGRPVDDLLRREQEIPQETCVRS